MAILELLNFQVILAQMICFFVLLFLLKKFLWKPVFQILEERQKKIEEHFLDLQNSKNDVAILKQEYQSFLDKTEEIAQQRIKQALEEGEQKAQNIRLSAHEEAKTIVMEAKDEIRLEMEKSKKVLHSDIVNMVIQATEKILQEKLTLGSDQKIVENFLADLEQKR